MSQNNEQTARRFVAAVQDRTSWEEIKEFYHPEVEHTEFPNAVTATKKTRLLGDLAAASASGVKLLQSENYAIQYSYSIENTVILEVVWTGVLAIPLGTLVPGDKITAYFAQFFEFKNGRIWKQRNYDCFEPLK